MGVGSLSGASGAKTLYGEAEVCLHAGRGLNIKRMFNRVKEAWRTLFSGKAQKQKLLSTQIVVRISGIRPYQCPGGNDSSDDSDGAKKVKYKQLTTDHKPEMPNEK